MQMQQRLTRILIPTHHAISELSSSQETLTSYVAYLHQCLAANKIENVGQPGLYFLAFMVQLLAD